MYAADFFRNPILWGVGCVPFSELINIKGNIIVWELGPKNMTMI
jgi:hypothetical protein